MFSKSTGNSSFDIGSPKPSMIKKKARTTILNVLNKRQTQEKVFTAEKKSSPFNEERTWRSEPATHPNEHGGVRIETRDFSGHAPKAITSPVNKTVHQSSRAPSSPTQHFHVRHPTSVQTRDSKQLTKTFERPITKRVAEPVVFRTPENPPQSPSNVSNRAQKWSNDGSKSSVQKIPREFSPWEYESSLRGVTSPRAVDTSSPGSPGRKTIADEEKGFSMIVQSSTSYPPPLRRKSSADVIPYKVTVNSIRIFEATPKMVEADPELLSRLDRYPSRDPPVMSPTSRERFMWEKDQITGIEREKRAVVRAGVPVRQRTLDSTSSNIVSSPKLVSDSVQVSIPFGVPGSPTSPRGSDSGSDSWTSSVSVCVPFQVTENEGVIALPSRGGTRPQSLPPADGTLAIEALRELGTDGGTGSSPSSPDLESLSQRYIDDSEDFIIGKSQSYRTKSTGEGSPREFDGPKLVTVRRKPVEETVQKIIHFDEALLQGQPARGRSDTEDGIGMSKHGKYSFVNQKYDQTSSETSNKSSVVTRTQFSKPASLTAHSSPKTPGYQTQYSTSLQKTSTLPTTGNSTKKDEIEMLKARIRQLEAELEQERQKQGPSEKILASISILEKEKLQLQSQVNETLQELSKAKAQLHSATYASNKHEAEKDILQVKYNKLQKDYDRIKAQNEVIEYERDQLLREKKNRANESEKDSEANLITIKSLSKQNEELILSESKLKERISILVKGLREVKESVKTVREENVLLHDEIVDNGVAMADTMKQCVRGLQQVIQEMNSQDEKKEDHGESVGKDVNDNEEVERLKEELQDSKTCVHALLQRVIELESAEGKSDGESKKDQQGNYDGCPNCKKLEEELKELSSQYDDQRQALEKMEIEYEEMSNENEDIQQEVKYLKKVLSYREDVMQVQVSEKTTRQLQRLETNLEEAEKKCKDLEDEVGRLHNQKQTLLVNILKLHEEEVAAQNGQDDDEDEDDDDDDDDEDDDGMSDEQKVSSFNRSKSPGKRPVYGNSENEFSSGASFYESDSDSESDEWSELEEVSERLRDYVRGIVSERKRLRSNVKELMSEKRNLKKRVDKSSNDFKSLMKRIQKLDSENVSLREKVKKDRRDLKAKLKKEEQESERLREKLKETEGEKEALMKCIEMNSSSQQVESADTTEELDVDDVSRLIAKAQAFALEEKDGKTETTSEESDEDESDGKDDEEEEEEEEKKEVESEEESSSSSEEEVKPRATKHRAKPQPIYEMERKSDSEEERKRNEEERKEENDIVKDEMVDIIRSPPPPPHARLLQRRASTIGINMDRVNREKQHLEEEVASLRKYLNRSANRRRFSTVEAPKTPPLGAMKTLESLLQKSDLELKEANSKISRLQSANADLEERIKDSEIMHDDLRQAVVIANNYAAEERDKNVLLEEERDELLQMIEDLKKENSRLKKSRSINAVYRKGTRSVKSLSANEEDGPDSEGADVESDFSSSRRSSIASDI